MRVWMAALCLIVVGTLAGCGDDSDDPEAPVTVTQTVTETPTPTPTPSEPTSLPPETESASPTESTPPAVDLSVPPTTYDEAEAYLAAAAPHLMQVEAGKFQTEDDKFYCTFKDRFIRPSCEILDSIHDPETCADSPSPNVGRIELTRRGWAPFCNTDTIRQPGAPTVAARIVVNWPEQSINCAIEGIGLTCVKTDTGQGFFLGPGRYQVF